MAGLGHEKFTLALEGAVERVDESASLLTASRSDLKRIARAAHAAGMTERDIAKATHRSGPAVHAWLHTGDASASGD